MNTPDNLSQFETLLGALVSDEEVRGMITQFTHGEFRRGYLHGQREMKLRVENALTSLRVEEV